MMRRINVNELTDVALVWAVATCEGYTDYCPETEKMLPPHKTHGFVQLCDLMFTTDWAQGGIIIEREINVIEKRDGYWYAWRAKRKDGYVTSDFKTVPASKEAWAYGSTPLIAAMRCYVKSKMGEEVEVPETLLLVAH
jgi:hypothetical protein